MGIGVSRGGGRGFEGCFVWVGLRLALGRIELIVWVLNFGIRGGGISSEGFW